MGSWGEIVLKVLRMDAHEDIVIPKYSVPNPVVVGFIETIGENKGQKKDYELTLLDGRRIHVREYEHCYKVHWDKISPLVNLIEHLRRDAPDWWKIMLALLGYFAGKATTED